MKRSYMSNPKPRHFQLDVLKCQWLSCHYKPHIWKILTKNIVPLDIPIGFNPQAPKSINKVSCKKRLTIARFVMSTWLKKKHSLANKMMVEMILKNEASC
jgi:hypothetical protein